MPKQLFRSLTDVTHQMRCGGDFADGVIAFEAVRWRINFIHMNLKANI